METETTIIEQYNAVKNNLGFFDFSIEGKIKISGKGRVDFINGLVSNDARGLKDDEGVYAAFLNKAGKILSDCVVYKFDDFLLINSSIIGKNNIIKKLKEEAALGKSEVDDVTLKYGLFSLQGPKSSEFISAIIKEPLNLKKQYDCIIKNISIDKTGIDKNNDKNKNKINNKTDSNDPEFEIIISKNKRTNYDGYDIFVPALYYKIVRELLLENGKRHGIKNISNETYNILRLEAKIPLFGIDFDDKNILPEITERAVSYTKGCYLGQEIVARVKNLAKGITAKKLKFLEIGGKENPEKNEKIFVDEKHVGFVTSAAFSPKLNKIIGFGFLNKGFYEDGNVVLVNNQKTIAESIGQCND